MIIEVIINWVYEIKINLKNSLFVFNKFKFWNETKIW